MTENGAKEGLEAAVLYGTDQGRLWEIADWLERVRPGGAGGDAAADSLRDLADRVGSLYARLSTGQLVEKERLLSDEAFSAAMDRVSAERLKGRPIGIVETIRYTLESAAALHTATQSKEGQDG